MVGVLELGALELVVSVCGNRKHPFFPAAAVQGLQFDASDLAGSIEAYHVIHVLISIWSDSVALRAWKRRRILTPGRHTRAEPSL